MLPQLAMSSSYRPLMTVMCSSPRPIGILHSCRLSSSLIVYGASGSIQLYKQFPTPNNKHLTVASLRHGHYEGLLWNGSKSNSLILQTRRASSNSGTANSIRGKTLQTDVEGFKHIYTGPLRGAVRAIKVFSLFTCVAAVTSAPVLIWLGNTTVPVVGRVLMTSLVTLVGVGTTGLLHWLLKGYVLQLHYNPQTQMVRIYTLSLIGTRKTIEFHISESGPPPSVSGFSSFQAKGKSYFLHTDVFKDKKLLSGLLGSFMGFEDEKIDKAQ